MSKIVSAVNVMILHPENIKDVQKKGDQIFYFAYKDKFWSIYRYEDDFILYFYPLAKTIEELL